MGAFDRRIKRIQSNIAAIGKDAFFLKELRSELRDVTNQQQIVKKMQDKELIFECEKKLLFDIKILIFPLNKYPTIDKSIILKLKSITEVDWDFNTPNLANRTGRACVTLDSKNERIEAIKTSMEELGIIVKSQKRGSSVTLKIQDISMAKLCAERSLPQYSTTPSLSM